MIWNAKLLFIVWTPCNQLDFSHKEDFDTAPMKMPWLIGENYLHVESWVPNFFFDEAQITSMQGRFKYIKKIWVSKPTFKLGRLYR